MLREVFFFWDAFRLNFFANTTCINSHLPPFFYPVSVSHSKSNTSMALSNDSIPTTSDLDNPIINLAAFVHTNIQGTHFYV